MFGGNRRKRRRIRQTWLIAVGILLIAVSAAGGLVLFSKYGNSQEREKEVQKTTQTSDLENFNEDTVLWNGERYIYNDHLTNYLLLGIDNREKTETSTGQANAGQADAIYLISHDRLKNTVTMIAIPRDTMTEIELFGPGGESLGTNIDHISLSFAYGDGSYRSCELTKEAVENLFYGLPIQMYCALNMDGLPLLTESVGSLKVTVPNNSLENLDSEYKAGEVVALDADNTELFLRYRDTEVSQSALARMERQEEFLKAFGEAAKVRQSEDTGYAANLYLSLKPYMVTNMNNGEFVKLAESLIDGTILEGWTVPGKGVDGEVYDEYQVDDDALYEKIIMTFYEEVE